MKIITLLSIFVHFECSFSKNEYHQFHVALLIDGARFCSGAFIQKNYVVTAASCVYDAFEVDVIMGIQNLLERNATAFILTSFIIHEDYKDNQNSSMDIALLKIDGLNETTDYQPLILPESNSKDKSDESSDESFRRLPLVSGFNFQGGSGILGLGSQVMNKFDKSCNEDRHDGDDYRNIGSPVYKTKSHGKISVLFGIVTSFNRSNTCVLKIDSLVDWILNKINYLGNQ